MPKTCSRSWRRIVWYIVSKAADRSSRVRRDTFPWSRECRRSFTTFSRAEIIHLCSCSWNHRGYEVSAKHPCRTYTIEFILHRSWCTKDSTGYLPLQYTLAVQDLHCGVLSYTVVWYTEDLTGYLRPFQYTLARPMLWSLFYAVTDTRNILQRICAGPTLCSLS